MKKLLSLIIGLFTLLPLCAQVDTQFWFAVPTLSQHSAQASYHLMVFAQEQAADVVITMPANSSFTAIKAHIDANGYKDIVIAADYTTAQSIFAVPYNQVSQRALNITSNAPIYCYCQITHYNGEAYTLKGRSALGTEFYVLSQHSLQNAPESDQAIYKEAYNSVEILATENNTQVTIAPSNNVGLACTTTPFTVTLNRGETYAFKACTKTAAGHLVGTKITSNRPIAVNSTDDSVYETNYAGADLCGDQLTPTDSWGKEYIAVGNNAWYECLTILAKEDNTVVNLDDGTSFTLNTGEVKDVPMSTVSTRYVRSNKPIGVWQMTGNIQESGGTNLPGLRCTGSREVKYQRTTGTVSTYIHIVTETVNINDFTLNGSPIAASKFYTVNGTNGDYSYASINVSSVSSGLIEVQCSSGPFHMAAIDNIATSGSGITSCTYGYFSAYNTSRQSSTTAVFQEGKSYIWEGHFEADGVTPMVLTKDGVYRDTVPTDGACDSICILYLSMSPCPPMEVRPDTTINAGDSARLWATGRDFYVWSPTTTIAEQDEQKYAVPTITTTYTVTGYNNPDDESANLVINGSFEDGNTGFETDLDYVSGYSPQGQYGNYGIKERVNQFWNSNKANTSTRAYEGTMMMVVDGATTANARVWEQQVTVQPHTYYTFSAQVMSCLASNTHGQYALLQFEVNGEQIGAIFHSPTVLYEWNRYSEMWYSGENTTATLTILNQNTDSKGNDFAMDDIRFEGMSTQCQATKTVTITVMKDCPTEPEDSTFLKPVICVNDLPYTHPETGVIYYEDAVSRRDIISEKDQYGCDSIIVVDMTILPQPTGDTTAYFYASRPFAWHDTTYAVAGDYPYLYPSERAPVCDSLVTLHLIEKTDCAPMEATVQVSDICADAKTMPVEIRLMSEEIGEMTLQFTNAPLNTMPFRDTTIVIDNYTSGQTMTIEVEVPHDAMDITRYPRPDEYTMQVVLRDYCNNVKAMDKQTFTVLYPSWITEQHWDDVIAIVNDKHNGGYTFSQVAWLRDGEVISGEEKLYLYLPHDLWTDEDHQTQSDHQYQALLTRSDDGKTVLSCPITPRRINNTDMMTGNKPYVDVTPTRVPVAYPTVHIMTNTTGTYQVMNMAGTVLQRQDYKPCEHGAMDITLPNSSGMYMIVFMPKDADKPLQDKYRVVRIIVE